MAAAPARAVVTDDLTMSDLYEAISQGTLTRGELFAYLESTPVITRTSDMSRKGFGTPSKSVHVIVTVADMRRATGYGCDAALVARFMEDFFSYLRTMHKQLSKGWTHGMWTWRWNDDCKLSVNGLLTLPSRRATITWLALGAVVCFAVGVITGKKLHTCNNGGGGGGGGTCSSR
jgi:hypothetical protein